MISNMKAALMIEERYVIAEGAFVKIVVWRVPQPVRKSSHQLKYRLALVSEGKCVLRYDNEAGKGDHRHVGNSERPHAFLSFEKLLADFWADVETWRAKQ